MAETRAEQTLLAERYRVEATLGVGGMGAVYRVRDERTGQLLALKELAVPKNADAAVFVTQFEREYHTLVQLRHPSIIEVYDYGVGERGEAFYTMELLDGEDLRERQPPSWRELCALLRDVASSLAILHSRRLLHRDISARNIRCTTNGRAKLIDFGAMAPMGVLKHVVGTPPFVAPEALQLQALDGRADLFSLGAVMYWLLVRRHAYPARNFSELPDLWRTPIASPRQYDVELPAALDQLIMQLLQLDRNARPASAAELFERLSGIANLPVEERPAVSAAYLATPTLIGRSAQLQRLRAQLVKGRQREGGAIIIEGGRGTGRSRLLDACVLDAKLLGGIVLRAEAADGASGDYGAARSLADQLVSAAPRLARRAAALREGVLSHLVPRLRETEDALAISATGSFQPTAPPSVPMAMLQTYLSGGPLSSGAPEAAARSASAAPRGASAPERRQIQTAFRDFMMGVARDRHLVLVIDDVDAIDEPSAALLALLVHAGARRKFTLVMSAPEPTAAEATSGSVLALLRQSSERLTLAALTHDESETLLRSVFGDVPNVAPVSEYVYGITRGNPGWTMELAEHLVSRGLARYQAGSWALPPTLSPDDLPRSLHERLTARLSEVSADARELAEALAVTDASLIAVADYPRLTDHEDRARTHAALGDLVARGVMVAAGDRYRFSHAELAAALREGLAEERGRRLHARASRVMDPAAHPLQVATHQLQGGLEREGIALVLALCLDDERMAPTLSKLAVMELAIAHAQRIGQPMRARALLQCRLLFQSALLGDYERFCRLMPMVRDRVTSQSGVAEYAALGEITDPTERAREAMRRARARHEATPEHERAFVPEEACAWVAYIFGACAYMSAIALELRFVADLPTTAPFVPLAPPLYNIDRMMDGQRAMQSGRMEVATEVAATMLREFEGPAYASITPADRARRRAPFMYAMGLGQAVLGKASALDYVAVLDQPHYRSNAWRVRMIYELMHGRSEEAAACQRRAELFALQDNGAAMLPGTTVRNELLASLYADDLLGVKRCMERSEALAAIYPRWKATFVTARAHYKRLQGDLSAALLEAQEALALSPAGQHVNWGLAVCTQLGLLNELGRLEEAQALGEAYLQTAQAERLKWDITPLLRVRAETCARLGRHDDALRFAEQHLEDLKALGAEGLQLGLAYETRARVAIAMRDDAAADHYAGLCAAQYESSRNALLSRKYQQLMREADRAGVIVAQRVVAEFTSAIGEADPARTLHSRLLTAANSAERAEHALRLLLEAHGATAGYLFRAEDGELALLAGSVEHEPSLELVRTLRGCLDTLTQSAELTLEPSDEEGTQVQAAPDPVTALFSSDEVEESTHSAASRRLDSAVDGFEPLPLFARPDGKRVLVALAALRFDGGTRRVVPRTVLTAFAEALQQESA